MAQPATHILAHACTLGKYMDKYWLRAGCILFKNVQGMYIIGVN